MSLRTKIIRLAYNNPGYVREALLPLIKSSAVRYDALIPFLEQLFPDEDPNRIIRQMKPSTWWSDYLTDEVMEQLNVLDLDVEEYIEDEYVHVVDPWGHGTSPDVKESYHPYTRPLNINVKVQGVLSTRNLIKLLDRLGHHKVDRDALPYVLKDRKFQRIMADILRSSLDTNEWWTFVEDDILRLADDEVKPGRDLEVRLHIEKAGPITTLKVIPGGRGEFRFLLKGFLTLDATVSPR